MYFLYDFKIIVSNHCIRNVLTNVINTNQQENLGGLSIGNITKALCGNSVSDVAAYAPVDNGGIAGCFFPVAHFGNAIAQEK